MPRLPAGTAASRKPAEHEGPAATSAASAAAAASGDEREGAPAATRAPLNLPSARKPF